jgi:tripartite-type tricarboxylate transporter receptor subunit TctC
VIPDVPTMAEAGFPGTELEIWHGIVAPAGTPPAIVAKLHDAFVAAAHDPDIVRLVEPQGADIVGGTPEAFGHLIAADLDRLGKIVRDAGIKMQ